MLIDFLRLVGRYGLIVFTALTILAAVYHTGAATVAGSLAVASEALFGWASYRSATRPPLASQRGARPKG